MPEQPGALPRAPRKKGMRSGLRRASLPKGSGIGYLKTMLSMIAAYSGVVS